MSYHPNDDGECWEIFHLPSGDLLIGLPDERSARRMAASWNRSDRRWWHKLFRRTPDNYAVIFTKNGVHYNYE